MQDSEGNDPVDELLAECLAVADPIAAIEAAARSHPELAVELRRRFAFLLRAGALPAVDAAATPRRLGTFELHERLGGGGMGIVHRATEHPIGRDVALKLIRPEHLWFDGARKRFLREIEAVAALDHPGIVPIYSAGEHDGVPYCAMELVRGRSLADVLAQLRDGAGTPTPAVLQQPKAANWTDACFAVVNQVAAALRHGHERGIVHRDVKPSNIMLGDDGRARLIDFGLARLATAESMTRSGVQPGSLAYMSPEQVRGEEVDARTDVWSLGVTLYELLTLRQPFLAATEAETRRRILDGAPPVPTSQASRLPWDAAIVVTTALAPERDRRYATMAAFADDLLACLERRPIHARRAGPLLRGRRWLQRHPARAAVWLAAAVLLLVLPTVLLLQERTAKDRIAAEAGRARVAEAAAMRKAETSRRVVQFLSDLFYEAEPERARGNTVPVRVILDRGVLRIRDELRDEPEVRAELLDTMCHAYLNLGLVEPAHRLADETLRVRQQELAQVGDALHATLELMARVAEYEGKEEEGERILNRLLTASPADEPVRAAGYRVALAQCAWRLGRTDEAERCYREGLQRLRELLPASAHELVVGERSYARFLMTRVDPHAAVAILRDVATRTAATRSTTDPASIDIELELAVAEFEDGDAEAAIARLREAIGVAERVFDGSHPTLALLRQWLATAMLTTNRIQEGKQQLDAMQAALAATFQPPHVLLARAASLESSFAVELGDLPRAARAANESIAMYEHLFPNGDLDFASVLANLARIECELGHLAAGASLADRSLRMHRALGQRRDDLMVLPLCYLASAQSLSNDLAAAEASARAAVELATTGKPRAGKRTLALAQERLAEVLLLADKDAEGERMARSAADAFAAEDVMRSRTSFVLGWAHNKLGRRDEAGKELNESLATLRQHYPESHPFFADVYGELGVLEARRGNLAAAVAALQSAVDIRRRNTGDGNPLLLLPLLNLGAVQHLLHREAEAVQDGFECLALVRANGGGKNRCAPSTLLLLAQTVAKLPDPGERERRRAEVRTAADELLPKDFPRREQLDRLLVPGK
ncbi:MAG: serine/threonine-protein kinase [Planctomycetota bacterium]